MLEKAIDGIDGGKDAESSEDILIMDNIEAAHKLIDMTVKIVAVKERIKAQTN